jgi:hypothetical protein
LTLYATVGPLGMVGAAGGAIAMIVGRLAANVFLRVYSRV